MNSKWDKYKASNYSKGSSMSQEGTSSEGMELLKNITDALGGGIAGLAHGGSEIGHNFAQFPFDAYSYFSGKPAYQVPQSDYFKELAPSSGIGQGSEKVGEFLAPFLGSPALAAETFGGKALFGSKMLPRLIGDALLGAGESESGHRKNGAAFGAAAPLLGKSVTKIKETPLTKSRAGLNLEKAKQIAGEESLGIPLSSQFIFGLKDQLQNPLLRQNKGSLNNLLLEASKGTYPGYFNLQSALHDISNELLNPRSPKGQGFLGKIAELFAKPQTTGPERLTGRELNNLRNQYIESTAEHLNKTGKGRISKLESQGRREYRNYKQFVPWRNAALGSAIAAALGAAGFEGAHKVKQLFHD